MRALFPLAMPLGGSFWPGGEGLGGEGIIGGWEGLRKTFGQGLPCLEDFPGDHVAG